MNNTLKKLISSENKRFIFLLAIFILALILSSFVYIVTGQGNITHINYESISMMNVRDIFIVTIKRNLIYFIAIILLTVIGQSKIINGLFGLISVYFGLSIIYLIRTLKMDVVYFVLTFTDYFIFFPLLFYFTFISSTISKYTKRTKNLEQITRKFDIIIRSYIKLSLIYLLIVTVYSIGYSYYILILSRLLVR
ncbi:hypothetical protein HZF24_05165 [Sedimentibacter hydroxybenzoicus DSM 7310]|uniref:Uncharacterized protein n=1 Tax=Sedimentibacter hydroxybenzoicus DSM 7310 TaxID=1123245 RepID=A0A974GVZ1_SEDHY|nr:hypothetical protein [Sedimentibacter hydroxybenzoicus]NYB73525.1 hypothetical protein [Sedimentibacter hydroxybenzoicus DSM 7310]